MFVSVVKSHEWISCDTNNDDFCKVIIVYLPISSWDPGMYFQLRFLIRVPTKKILSEAQEVAKVKGIFPEPIHYIGHGRGDTGK